MVVFSWDFVYTGRKKIKSILMRFFRRLFGLKGTKKFPSNVLVTAPHGSAKVPLRIFHHLSFYYQTSPRLLLNFSDYGTKYLIEDVPDDQKVIPKYGRLVGDPNRASDADDIVRFEDFGGNRVFRKRFEHRIQESLIRFFWRTKLLNYSYKPFYKDVYKAIERMAQNPENEGKPLVLIDLHDTGNRILGPRQKEDRLRKNKIPTAVISNAPDAETEEGQFGTAPEYFMKAFAETLAEELEVSPSEVKQNHIFQGGNIIRTFGNVLENSKLEKVLNGKKIFAIQLEFNRALYLNEVNQRPYPGKMRRVRRALMRTIRAVGSFEI